MVLVLFTLGCKDNPKPKPKNEATQPRPVVQIPAADFEAAVKLRNRGIGLLENKDWKPALEHFDQLAKLLPESPTVLRNKAVAHVLALVDPSTPFKKSGSAAEKQEYRNSVQQATAAIAAFRKSATESTNSSDTTPAIGAFNKALADHLEGLLLIADDSSETGGFDAGLALLKKAADGAAERADFRFAVGLAMDGHRTFSMGDTALAADLTEQFQEAFQLAPTNLFAFQRLLKQQALTLTSKHDAVRERALQIKDTLQAGKALLQPLNESMKKQHDFDALQTIDSVLATENDLAKMGPAITIANLVLPELATKIDQRRINKNLLEYLELNFDSDYLKKHGIEGTPVPNTKSVISEWKTANAVPNLSEVTDLQVRDFNLDGVDDVLVAREGRFEVYFRPSVDSDEWTLLVQSPSDLSTPIKRFLTADLDRDSDRTISTVAKPVILLDADGDRRIPSDFVKKDRWYDTDLDVIAYGPNGLCLLQNGVGESGKRQLTEWKSDFPKQPVHDAVVADIDADGDLDLILGTDQGISIYQTLDVATFERLTDSVAGPDFPIHSIQAVDLDSNVAIDFAAASNDGRNGFLENMLHGRFRWLDETKTNNLQSSEFALQAERNGRWKVVSAGPAEQLLQADLDNDGWFDLIRVNDGRLSWHRGNSDGAFETSASQPAFPETLDVSRVSLADLDSDGDLDVLATSRETGQLLLIENQGGNTNGWMEVVGRAVFDDPQNDSSRVNMHAIGSVAELWIGDHRQRQMITQPRTHFGLGQQQAADLLRIIWTDGIPQNVTEADALRGRIAIQTPQILKGSCPYIYTWTGQQFEFFSDCLWAAPLGLVGADGTVAPTREWENLLIPGEALAEKQGQYVLQLTEELWEIAYFDQVELFAVDHPADVSVFTNEKVGPASMAEHKIHAARNPRLPVSVTNAVGRDLLPGLSELDKDYVQPFEGRQLQGLADEWTMEFDLGNLRQADQPSPESIKLFLTGWIFPTDTSLNLAIHQNPSLKPPMPPVIEVPGADGKWTVVRPFIGFPSGKTKAMVVDISDVFSPETTDFRFRLRSTMELYFDQAFFTLNEPEFESTVQPCKLAEADLHYRGFSRREYSEQALFRNGHAPEGYDYNSVTMEARWPTIHGRFTKFGDVSELLTAHDDQMIVMGPGDEVTVKFSVPSTPVPKGWKRDFVLRNVGFDKDADLNTIYGQTSEPFPFRKMTRYPFSPDTAPDTVEYQQYLEFWQTRTQDPYRFFHAGQQAVHQQSR